jgi:hypothetical protein
MAIEYSLELNGSDAEQVADLLAHAAAGSADGDFHGDGAVLDSGVLVAVSASTPLPFPDPVEQALGVTPAVHVLFRFDKDTDPAAQRTDMVRLVAAVLTAIPGDAVLTFAGEVVWLLRKGGQLTISDRDGFWTPETTALLPGHHDRASLPDL